MMNDKMKSLIERCTVEHVKCEGRALEFDYKVNAERLVEEVIRECLCYVRCYNINADDVDCHDSINFAYSAIAGMYGLKDKMPKYKGT